MNSNKPSADDKCHICGSDKREDGMCLCAESWRNPLPTPAPVESGRMNKQQVKDYFDAVDKMEFKMPVAELPNEAEGKAKELVKAIKKINWRGDPESDKAIAAYCVDEILKTDAARYTHQEQYWQQVRTAINQL